MARLSFQNAVRFFMPPRLLTAWRSFSPRTGAQRSLWAVTDQAVVSGGSFLFNLVLARMLPSGDFGTAVLVIGGLYLLQTVHRSLVLYPLSLRVAAAGGTEVAHLAVSAAMLSAPLSLLLGTIMAAASMVFSHGYLAGVLVLLVVASQSHELLRWIFLAQLQHRGAVIGDALRYGCALGFLALLSLRGVPGIRAAFACIAVGALAGVAWQLWRLRLHSGRPRHVATLAADGWRLGRWDLFAGSVAGLSAQVMTWSLAAWHGAVETARMQAVANLLGATHPVMFGLGNLITPAVAKSAEKGGRTVRIAAVRYAAIGLLALIPYLAFLFCFPGATLALVYGSSSAYITEAAPLRWFVAIYAMVYLQMAAKSALNGLGRSRDAGVVSCAGLALQLVIVVPLAKAGGLEAACIGSVLAGACDAVLAVRFLTRATATESEAAECPPELESVGASMDA